MKRPWIVLGFSAFFLTSLRLLYVQKLDLLPDEAYYWSWSKHLSLSYFDHPPFIAFLIAFFGKFLGDNEISVRIGATLLCSVSSLILARFAWVLFRSYWTSIIVFFFANFILIFSAGALIMTPDTPFIFFWTCSLYALWLALHAAQGEKKWWWVLGGTVGLGLLSKYTMVLFFPCALVFLLVAPSLRIYLRKSGPYLAVSISLILFTPVFIWNYQNQGVSFAFQWQHGMAPRQGAGIRGFFDYLGGQAVGVTPLIFLALVFGFLKIFQEVFYHKEEKRLFFLCFSGPVLLFFWLASLRSRSEINWPVCGYLSVFLALAADWDQSLVRPLISLKKPILIYSAMGLALIVSLLAHFLILYPVYPLSPDMPFLRRHYGWKELGLRVNDELTKDSHLLLAAESYQIASELLFYTGKKEILFLGNNLPFYPMYQWRPAIPLQGSNALLVSEGEPAPSLLQRFERFEPESPLFIYKDGRKVKIFCLCKCYNFKGH